MPRRIILLSVCVITLLLLVACGGGESAPESVPTSEPATDTAPASESEVEEEAEEPAAEEVEEEPAAEEVEERPAAEEAEATEEETEAETESADEAYPPPTVVIETQSYPEPANVPEPYPEPSEEERSTGEGSSEGAAGSRTFQVVTEESDASYTVEEEFLGGAVSRLGKELGLFVPVGVTQEVSGQLTLNLDGAPTLESGEIIVDISQLTSDDNRRDNRIRERALQSATYPIATFVATGIEGAPESYQDGQEVTFLLLGDITIREITQPATFEVTTSLTGDTIKGVATTQLLMTDFGFDPPSMTDMFTVQDEVLVTVNLTARETP